MLLRGHFAMASSCQLPLFTSIATTPARPSQLCQAGFFRRGYGARQSLFGGSTRLCRGFVRNVCSATSDTAVIHPADLGFAFSGIRNSDDHVGEYGRLMPCPPGQLPPRVEHMIVKKGGNVITTVVEALDLPRLYVEDLLAFGAIHSALLCPTPPPTATPEQFELYKEFSLLFDHSKRSSLKGKTVREAQKTYRVQCKEQEVEEGSYLRVHVHPKRSPRCYDLDWESRVVAQTKSYVVLDKPAGVSVGGTVDNLEETCAMFAARALRIPAPLFLTHQIDTCTEGCVVLAKTKEFASKFHGLLRDRKVKKVYRALATGPVPLEIVTHYMRSDRLPPRLVSTEAHVGWQLCQMEILSCNQKMWPSSVTMKQLGIRECGWKPQSHAYECKVRLLTGRTHQIRAQFAALGSPLVGDSMYIPATIARLKFPEVDPLLKAPVLEAEACKTWVGNVKDRRDGGVMERWVSMHGREPDCGLGLQACQISWEDGKFYSYEPGPPWWET